MDFVADLGVTFVADWTFLVGRVVSNGQDWYWLSSDIVGVNSTGFFAAKFIYGFALGIGCTANKLCG